ncbi:MAG: hypothetical protein VYD19_00575 [Myxococcota bacterium]|nr:hypothetical protein [Myxococcota bacterium]
MPYSAYELTEESRHSLIAARPPRFSKLITHHVTYRFPDNQPPPVAHSVQAIGFVEGEAIECWVVSIDGTHERPDKGTFHITASLDPALGAKPVHSNKLLKKEEWIPLEVPIPLEVSPKLLGLSPPKMKTAKSRQEEERSRSMEGEND